MATLFLAQKRGAAGFSRAVAIKLVHPELQADEQFRQMFLDEALLASRIHHPNVVQVEELAQLGEVHYLVMEFVHGCSLSQLMRVLYQRKRRLTPDFAVRIAMHIAEGLHAAHETRDEQGRLLSVVHRDVSPENILLAYAGHVKLIDFGIAKAFGRRHRTQEGLLKGKFRYMAPEQALARPVDRRTDIYQLGIVLWEMLTLRRLFDGETDVELIQQVRAPHILPPSAYVDRIPPALDAAVMAALQSDPTARPRDAESFARLLAKATPGAFAVDGGALRALLEGAMQEERRRDQATFPPELYAELEEQARTEPLGGMGERLTFSRVTVEHHEREATQVTEPAYAAAQALLEPEPAALASPSQATEPAFRLTSHTTLEEATSGVRESDPSARDTRPGFASPGGGASERARPLVYPAGSAPEPPVRGRRLVRLASEIRTTITRITDVEWAGTPALWLAVGVGAGLLAALLFVGVVGLHRRAGAPRPPSFSAGHPGGAVVPRPPSRGAAPLDPLADQTVAGPSAEEQRAQPEAGAASEPASPGVVVAGPRPSSGSRRRAGEPRRRTGRGQVVIDGTPLFSDPGL